MQSFFFTEITPSSFINDIIFYFDRDKERQSSLLINSFNVINNSQQLFALDTFVSVMESGIMKHFMSLQASIQVIDLNILILSKDHDHKIMNNDNISNHA